MSITSYGYCYFVLIVAGLRRAGISETDDAVNACFNFADHLAFETYQHRTQHTDAPFDFNEFLKRYKEQFFIEASIINRLKNDTYGIISENGAFRTEYMYYYFLGRFLASHAKIGTTAIDTMCENSHVESNYLTLLFTIHHTNSNDIIDHILLRTMCTLDSVAPATLGREETRKFGNILAGNPASILSANQCENMRDKERTFQDNIDQHQIDTDDVDSESEDMVPVNGNL